jgi:hypothetical protein
MKGLNTRRPTSVASAFIEGERAMQSPGHDRPPLELPDIILHKDPWRAVDKPDLQMPDIDASTMGPQAWNDECASLLYPSA